MLPLLFISTKRYVCALCCIYIITKGYLRRKVRTAKRLDGKVSDGEVPLRQKVHTANSPYGERSARQFVPTAKCPYGEKSHGKLSHGEWSAHALLQYVIFLSIL